MRSAFDEVKLSIGEKVSYERRIVAFYDVMGWRTKIEAAGSDAEKIGNLRSVLRIFAMVPSKDRYPFEIRQTTFSDNIVVSAEVTQNSVFNVLLRLAFTQLLSAQVGYFLRGGVTIGDIVHDEYVVFGPALNRAYHLESKVADKPRIVLDKECLELFPNNGLGSFVADEDGVSFLNPWTTNAANVLWTSSGGAARLTTIGGPQFLLTMAMAQLAAELKRPLADKDRARLVWLRDLVAAGWPST